MVFVLACGRVKVADVGVGAIAREDHPLCNFTGSVRASRSTCAMNGCVRVDKKRRWQLPLAV